MSNGLFTGGSQAGDAIGGLFSGGGEGGVMGLDWLNVGSSLLGSLAGNGATSSATAVGAPVSVNNSGFSVTNAGNATSEGGSQSTDASQTPALPWYVWAAGGLLLLAIARKVK